MKFGFIEVAGKKTDILLSALLFEKVQALKYGAMPRSVGSFVYHLQSHQHNEVPYLLLLR